MKYRIFFKTGKPKSQLIENVKYVEMAKDVIYFYTELVNYEFSIFEIERFYVV